MSEYIMNRESLKRHCEAMCHKFKGIPTSGTYGEHKLVLELLKQTTWIPVSESLPKDLEPVNITWVNHEPESYYKNIKDKPFTATGVYFNGQWYWWSTLCIDTLAEYGDNYDDIIDETIEITAWMPLPHPYRAESEEV